MKIILTGNPISNNSLYKRGKGNSFYMTQIGKDTKKRYQLEALSQKTIKEPIKKEVVVEIRLYFKNKAKHDYDNYGKILNDSFNGIIWEDDSQVRSAIINKCYDKKNPRIEVDVYEYGI